MRHALLRRGEVWLADLDPSRGGEIGKRRPVLLISREAAVRHRSTRLVVPLSTGPTPRFPLIIAVPSAGPESVAVYDQTRAVDKSRLMRRLAVVSDDDLLAVELGLRQVLGL